ncbi:MAG: OmpH family outer membrane protein [Bacteroidetes bacterium]|nr:OmpH family outer membrane protein [Bacteroidota bacterium]MBS1932251.1 OmpH family outer membrane protein [Bacteroidota bacterium]
MKNFLLVLNLVLLGAVGYLFYLQFGSKKTGNTFSSSQDGKDVVVAPNSFRIAYFDMDSVEKNFQMVKEVKEELNKKEDAMNSEVDMLGRSYQKKANDYQAKAQSMTQSQSESATQDLLQMQDQIKNRRQSLSQEYNDLVTRKMADVRLKIEEFLKNYNKDKGYSYIISYEPGLFYYKDTIYNITNDVVQGLNGMYKGKN